MKTVILAGGLGTRLAEETDVVPKPMVAIGGMPIIWHIMKTYYHSAGVTDFVVCLGYRGYVLKEYFANYALHAGDVTIDLGKGSFEFMRRGAEPWRVTLVDTGSASMTGGRLKRIRDLVDGETFFATYGDGVADVDLPSTLALHKQHRRMATMTAVVPPGRYGALALTEDSRVEAFLEKPPGDGGSINGGYFVLEPEVLDLIEGDASSFEEETLPVLAQRGELFAYRHTGFWHAMDTLRDRRQLEDLWLKGKAPWKVWE